MGMFDFLKNVGAMKYPVIFDANREVIKDPDFIYPGQVLEFRN